MFIDAHAHLDEVKELAPVLKKSRDAGCRAIVSSGYSFESSKKNLGIAKANPGFVYAVIGVSPQAAMDLEPSEFEKQLAFIRENAGSAVAIGEIGLDFHWAKTDEQVEREYKAFEAQVDLALEKNLPIVIHSRKAEEEALEVLARKKAGLVMLHFFSGKPETALSAVDRGFMVSFPPLKSRNRSKTAKKIPLENIVLETDCPYVYPDPTGVLVSAEIVARAKGILIEEVLKTTSENTARFFGFSLE